MTDERLIEMIKRIENHGSGAAQSYSRFELTAPMRELLELRSPGTVVPMPEAPKFSVALIIMVIFAIGTMVLVFGGASLSIVFILAWIAAIVYLVTDL